MQHRRSQIEAWLSQLHGLPGGDRQLETVSGDASFRRYWRLRLPDGATRIVMDAPPEREPLGPFMDVAGRLQAAGLRVPEILACEREQGFLLLSDLGDRVYFNELNVANATEYYDAAIQALLRMQRRADSAGLSAFDDRELRRETALFHDWLLVAYLEKELDPGRARLWRDTETLLVHSALVQPQVFVHRDYHSRNLLQLPGSPGLPGGPGILDFQDAVRGPLSYDLVSLLKDCYLEWPEERVHGWALDYLGQVRQAGPEPGMDTEEFLLRFDLMGAQRHLKAAGIFCRLWLRDGKPHYLDALPRTLGYIVKLKERRPALGDFAEWLETEVLPALKHPPCAP